MSTKSLTPVDAEGENFRGYLTGKNWSLCLGAGVSKGISPDWHDLAFQLISEAFRGQLSEQTFNEMVAETNWTLDGWVQAAANQFSISKRKTDDFVGIVEEVLYSKVREKAKGCKLDRYLTQVLNRPLTAPKNRAIEVCDFLEEHFGNSSVFAVGRFLIDAARQQKGPKGVITFNADTFLETYITLFLRREHYAGPGPHNQPEHLYVARSGTGIDRASGGPDKIPIYHCHGSITPQYRDGFSTRDARDRLIFLEQEYLDQSSAGASWPQTVFMFHAQSTKMAFLGLSMADPNIRRWLNLNNSETQQDVNRLSSGEAVNPSHIWLRPKPALQIEQDVLLSSLVHLGVRPAWLESWATTEFGLQNLLALKV